jgi:hypothetical protein
VHVHGSVSETRLVLTCDFNNAQVIDHWLGDMRISRQLVGVTASLEMEIGQDANRLSGKFGPFNVEYHEQNGQIVVTNKASNGSDPRNPKRDFSMTRASAINFVRPPVQ